ncbi:CDP-diacylglycerol--glycerol-3-phosphate 3-phosphatidyltransferase [Lacipirellula sp.]|uniref:CDP-diacylglycerol--glycerol-3-phosphate 3-phosphatidyltransferase n=1 Tax=Lacipirellula sp. TaxID=2691419 RepID=UPI003D0BDC6F
MSDTALPAAKARVLNVPNMVTISRLILAVVLFGLMSFSQYTAALVTFIVAASTDWVDGYWARKYGQVTQLGRILDPFADKMIICGTFIYLAAAPQLVDGSPASSVTAWMATVILARELAVTALRSFIETNGGDFSAKWAGKWKMVFQCIAAGFSIGQLQWFDAASRSFAADLPGWVPSTLHITLWIALILTIYSGLEYIWVSVKVLKRMDG